MQLTNKESDHCSTQKCPEIRLAFQKPQKPQKHKIGFYRWLKDIYPTLLFTRNSWLLIKDENLSLLQSTGS
jgi:hypothetical protein